jgi:hypothetical protein
VTPAPDIPLVAYRSNGVCLADAFPFFTPNRRRLVSIRPPHDPFAQTLKNLGQRPFLQLSRFLTIQPQPISPLAPESRSFYEFNLDPHAGLMVFDRDPKSRI